jgi:hypothetical protein
MSEAATQGPVEIDFRPAESLRDLPSVSTAVSMISYRVDGISLTRRNIATALGHRLTNGRRRSPLIRARGESETILPGGGETDVEVTV